MVAAALVGALINAVVLGCHFMPAQRRNFQLKYSRVHVGVKVFGKCSLELLNCLKIMFMLLFINYYFSFLFCVILVSISVCVLRYFLLFIGGFKKDFFDFAAKLVLTVGVKRMLHA